MQDSDLVSEIETSSNTVSPSKIYSGIRSFSERLCATLEKEDCVLQSMTDASPVRWHLAHTTWFFETFVLRIFDPEYTPFDPRFAFLFNSYYVQAGARFSRPDRGLLSRPTMDEVYAYRQYVNEHLVSLLHSTSDSTRTHSKEIRRVVTVGINHEQQHQELILTDIKHALAQNPIQPAIFDGDLPVAKACDEVAWLAIPEGLVDIGADTASFHFDNEGPRHKYYLESFCIADRPVTNQEFLAFVEAGGYKNQLLWLDKAWSLVTSQDWNRPLYWYQDGEEWFEYTLYGPRLIDMNAPVAHVSFYEADAYARWAECRLPTEFEWEAAVAGQPVIGHFSEDFIFHPIGIREAKNQQTEVIDRNGELDLCFGTVWEWTKSQYSAYPGYSPESGALGEYNGKFMCDQFVLKGGSVATSASHFRLTYRNFFPGHARWQFAGIRLAKDS